MMLKAEHLFDQALRLSKPIASGPPRQVDLRRGVSAAYYGLFHFVLASLADEFVGISQRHGPRYALVYRSLGHRGFRDLCSDAMKPTLPGKYAPYLTAAGFGPHIRDFAALAVELQQKRHKADYDPRPRFGISDVTLAVSAARGALEQFRLADPERRKIFLTLLICPPR